MTLNVVIEDCSAKYYKVIWKTLVMEYFLRKLAGTVFLYEFLGWLLLFRVLCKSSNYEILLAHLLQSSCFFFFQTTRLSIFTLKAFVRNPPFLNVLPLRSFYLTLKNKTWSAKLNQIKQIKFNTHMYTYSPHFIFSHKCLSKNNTIFYVHLNFYTRKHDMVNLMERNRIQE